MYRLSQTEYHDRKDSYPFPRMNEYIDSLGEATVFPTLDAYCGYWQLKLRKQDRPKTAFVCHAGTFQYTRMPFGLANAPASFQRVLDLVLTKYKRKNFLVSFDDIIIYSKTVEEHIRHLDEILQSLRHAGGTIKIKKCKFFKDKVEYLGHIITPDRLQVDEANTPLLLRNALPPRNKSELRCFLGLCNVYRRFIKNFSQIAGPLNELLKKNNPDKFTFTEEQTKQFNRLIGEVTSPPILRLPKRNSPLSVDADASAYGLGCVLFQTDEETARHPIGFRSR